VTLPLTGEKICSLIGELPEGVRGCSTEKVNSHIQKKSRNVAGLLYFTFFDF